MSKLSSSLYIPLTVIPILGATSQDVYKRQVVGFIEAGARLHVQPGGGPAAQGGRPGTDDGLEVVAYEGSLRCV